MPEDSIDDMEDPLPELEEELLPEVRQERWEQIWSKATFEDIPWDNSDITAKIYVTNDNHPILIVEEGPSEFNDGTCYWMDMDHLEM